MSKRVILHIGMLKTGTTSLQAYLRANSDVLAESGVGYYLPSPLMNRSMSNAGFLCWGSYFEACNNSSCDPGYAEEMDLFSEYAKDHDTLILSEEFMWEKGIEIPEFWGVIRKNLMRMLGDDTRIDVVVFVRRQDDWILSRWKEYIQNTFGERVMDFPEYFDYMKKAGFMDYYEALRVIESYFGKDHMRVCSYDKREDADFNTVRSFLKATGINAEKAIYKGSMYRNRSICMRAANAMLLINSVGRGEKLTDEDIVRAARTFSIMYPDEQNYYPMSEEDHEKMLEDLEEGNRKMSCEYNGGRDLFSGEIGDHIVWQNDPKQEEKDAGAILKLASVSNETCRFLANTVKKIRDDKSVKKNIVGTEKVKV